MVSQLQVTRETSRSFETHVHTLLSCIMVSNIPTSEIQSSQLTPWTATT